MSIGVHGMKNYLLTIAYDGSGFHGWQKQPKEKTVQGYLEQTFSRLFDREIALNGTSRTDAGVHALGQRASFRADIRIPTDRLARVMNNALCGREEGSFALSPVRILEAREVPEEFHARFDSKGKRYLYRIRPSRDIDVFRRSYVYHVENELDGEVMDRAAKALIGTQDFKSFEASGGTPRETTVREIFDAGVITGGQIAEAAAENSLGAPDSGAAGILPGAADLGAREDELIFHVSGDGFLYNMVRIITGTLVEIGRGSRRPEEMKAIIEGKDRALAGHTAPPYGLYLAEVFYGQQTGLG